MEALLCKIVAEIVNPLIMLMAGGAFIVFLWGLVKFISTASAGGEMAEGKNHMIWGILGLVIIFGAYGIINVVLTSFGVPSLQHLSCPVSA